MLIVLLPAQTDLTSSVIFICPHPELLWQLRVCLPSMDNLFSVCSLHCKYACGQGWSFGLACAHPDRQLARFMKKKSYFNLMSDHKICFRLIHSGVVWKVSSQDLSKIIIIRHILIFFVLPAQSTPSGRHVLTPGVKRRQNKKQPPSCCSCSATRWVKVTSWKIGSCYKNTGKL